MAAPRMSWPLTRVHADNAYDDSGYYRDEKRQHDVEVHDVPVSPARSGSEAAQVVGSADIFDENGNIRLIPVRTRRIPSGLSSLGPVVEARLADAVIQMPSSDPKGEHELAQ